jgi:hypothetical protein
VKHTSLISALFILCYATIPAVADVVLFSDDFNRTTGIGDGNRAIPTVTPTDGVSDWGPNYTISRTLRTGGNQIVTGTPFIGTAGSSVQQTALGNVGTIMNGNARTNTSFLPSLLTLSNPAPTGGFKVSFNFDRATDNSIAGNGFIGIGFGIDPSGTLVPATADTWAQDNSTFAVSFQQATTTPGNNPNGNMQTFYNATNTVSTTALTNSNYGTSTSSPVDLHSVEIVFTPQSGLNTAFNAAGNLINYSIFVDDLGTAKLTGSFTTRASDDLGLLTFSSNRGSQGYIDNLSVTAFTAVPEPTTIALLASIGFVGVGRRWLRRKTK